MRKYNTTIFARSGASKPELFLTSQPLPGDIRAVFVRPSRLQASPACYTIAMPFPQPAIEQLSQRAPRSPAWFGQLMMFGGTLFFVAVAIYIGIIFGYKPYLNHRVDSLNQQIATFAQQVPAEQQAEIATFYSQLVNLKGLLNKHVAMTSFFAWLEQVTLPSVQIQKLNVSGNNRQASITGVARTVTDIASQLAVLESQPGVERINLKNVTNANGAWQFDMTVSFVPGFFNQTAQIQ